MGVLFLPGRIPSPPDSLSFIFNYNYNGCGEDYPDRGHRPSAQGWPDHQHALHRLAEGPFQARWPGFLLRPSHKRGQPLDSPIGVGGLIKGWDEAVPTMKVGEKAVLDISSDYGYGAQAIPNLIPAHSDLIFEVELVGIK